MGSSGKTRTTFAKLSRESKLRDKRADKEARKAARKLDAAGAGGDLGSVPEGVGPASSDLGITEGPEAEAGPDTVSSGRKEA